MLQARRVRALRADDLERLRVPLAQGAAVRRASPTTGPAAALDGGDLRAPARARAAAGRRCSTPR